MTQTSSPPPVVCTLVFVDPTSQPRPRARWYALSLEPTLFGGVDLVRRWGRLGTAAHHPARVAEHYPDATAARAGLERAHARRRRRGYVPSPPPASPRQAPTGTGSPSPDHFGAPPPPSLA